MLGVLAAVTLAVVAGRVWSDVREGRAVGRSAARRAGEAGLVWLAVAALLAWP